VIAKHYFSLKNSRTILKKFFREKTTIHFYFLLVILFIVWGLYKNKLDPLTWYAITAHSIVFILLLCTSTFVPLWSQFRLQKHQSRYIVCRDILCVVLGIVLSIEIFFRIFPVYDTLGLNPGCQYFWPDWYNKRNNLGYNDRDFTFNKPHNRFRILVAGDSVTEGAGVTRQETFAAILEKQLNVRLRKNRRPHTVEVYNLGQCGLNTQEEVELITRNIPLLQPDFIVLAYVMNDAELHPVSIRVANTPLWIKKIHGVFIKQITSYAYYWFFKHITIFTTPYRAGGEVSAAQHDPEYAGWKNVEQALNTYKQYLNTHRLDNLNLIWPLFKGFQEDTYPSQLKTIHSQVSRAFLKRKLAVIDLFPFFQAQNRSLTTFAFSSDDGHPGKEAHALVGELLANEIYARESFQNFLKK
jgi:lysophospholipase L1-like esterase